MGVQQTYLLPSLALVLLLAVGSNAADVGECNEKGGECVKTYSFLRVQGDDFCYKMDQIAVSDRELSEFCGNLHHVCCEAGKKRSVLRRKCDNETTKKCKKQGGKCRGDCATLARDGLCNGASCVCCIKNEKGCSPKAKHEDKDGFCVAKRKYCEKAGGTHIVNGCDCDRDGKTHFCYKEKFHWSYEGEGAPEFWKDHFPLCGLERQSPIDIMSGDAEKLTGASNFVFTLYDDTPDSMTLVNNGHSVTCYWEDAAKPFVAEGGLDDEYIVAQFHFHWGADSTKGSEHLIDSKAYPIELHIVHYKASYGSLGEAVKYGDGLAVLGIMFEVGAENAALKPITDALSNVVDKGAEYNIQYDMPLEDLLPANTNSFYRYLGSLTTPSCNEVVVWTVFKDSLKLSEAQLEAFRTLLDSKEKPIVDNFRPVQPLNGRTVYTYDGKQKRRQGQ